MESIDAIRFLFRNVSSLLVDGGLFFGIMMVIVVVLISLTFRMALLFGLQRKKASYNRAMPSRLYKTRKLKYSLRMPPSSKWVVLTITMEGKTKFYIISYTNPRSFL